MDDPRNNGYYQPQGGYGDYTPPYQPTYQPPYPQPAPQVQGGYSSPTQNGMQQQMPYPAQQAYQLPRQPVQPTAPEQTQILTPGGFKPLSKEEREEAARVALEAGFSFDGYQVVRREFFSHRYDPTLTIKGNSITFNNACISKLDEVVYVQVLVNPQAEKLVIRPCQEGARDAIRWCVKHNDKRKSREITCGLFTAKLYDMMGWEALYRYKLQGTQITYQGEQLYVFDLTSTEIFLPQVKQVDEATGKPIRRAPRPVYPADWRDSFGIPVQEHTASTQINLLEGYQFADGSTGRSAAQKAHQPSSQPVTEQLSMETVGRGHEEVAGA